MIVWLIAVSFVPMIAEAQLSARHERVLRGRGAVEPGGDVYAVMRLAYPACFVGMLAEGAMRGLEYDRVSAVGLAIFGAAKALKYWAMASLGERWTFRVLVPPHSSRIDSGPYRFVRHPNYVAVMGELMGMALMTRAPLGGAAAALGFGALIAARIRVEEQALGGRS